MRLSYEDLPLEISDTEGSPMPHSSVSANVLVVTPNTRPLGEKGDAQLSLRFSLGSTWSAVCDAPYDAVDIFVIDTGLFDDWRRVLSEAKTSTPAVPVLVVFDGARADPVEALGVNTPEDLMSIAALLARETVR